MKYKYKIGDRVIVIKSPRYRNEQRIGKSGLVTRYSLSSSDFKGTGVYYVDFIGGNEVAYLCEDEIELDKEYYRNSKLIELLMK